jgi:hypothetical protein
MMYFGYTYAPNLTHQGVSVITEKSSATLHTMVKKNINSNNNYSTYNTKIHQKKIKYILGSKIKAHKFTKGGARTMRMITQPSAHIVRKIHNCL